jgi:hypothetical protein
VRSSATRSKLMLSTFVLSALFGAVVLSLLVGRMRPFDLDYMRSGLDPSWVAALNYSLEQGLRFGADINFTFGPLHFVATKQFVGTSSAFGIIFIASIIVYISTWAATLFFDVYSRSGAIFSMFIAASIGSAALYGSSLDGLYFVIPMIAVSRGLQGDKVLGILGIILSSILCIAKFSFTPIALGAALILDGQLLAKGRRPYATPLLLLVSIVVFVGSGQRLEDFFPYVLGGLHVASGYSSAMGVGPSLASVPGLWSLLLWIAAVVSLVFLIFKQAFHDAAGMREVIVRVIPTLLLFCGFFLVLAKAAFVRHDMHELIAWTSIAFGSLCVLTTTVSRSSKAVIVGVVAISILSSLAGVIIRTSASGSLDYASPLRVMQSAARQGDEALKLVSDPRSWFEHRILQSARSTQEVASASSFPSLEGTVDVISSRQAELIALGLDYHPRPTVQEYVTYSPWLASRNEAFFESSTAPDFLIFEPGSIDGRHPASAEGSLWPLFFERYQSVALAGSALVLERRAVKLASILGDLQQERVALGEWFGLPAAGRIVFVRMNVEFSAVGWLVNLLFKAPYMTLTVAYDNGPDETFRLIPGQISEGMLISPTVKSAYDFLALERVPDVGNILRWPVAFRVDAQPWGRIAYKDVITISLQEVSRRDFSLSERLPFDTSAPATVWPLVANNALSPPTVGLTNDGLFAHADASLRLPTGKSRRLAFTFGMRDADYASFSGADGVCFLIAVAATSQELFRRCLDPKQKASDVGPQEASIEVPSGSVLVLRTVCRANCSYDWSYWGSVELE